LPLLTQGSKKQLEEANFIDTLNLEATDENLYEDLIDSSGNEVKSPETNWHFEDDRRLQCSATI
jgi:hypothetical protein